MRLEYCLMVTGSAYGNQKARSALQFAQALLRCGHIIKTIFFYQEGIYNANQVALPSDEVNLAEMWRSMAQQYQIDLQICISAALRRGIVHDETNAEEHFSIIGYNKFLKSGFKISSLSQLAQSMSSCDRFIQF